MGECQPRRLDQFGGEGIVGHDRLKPFPLDGGRVRQGVSAGGMWEGSGDGRVSGVRCVTTGANTPYPDPSPIEGEGSHAATVLPPRSRAISPSIGLSTW